MCNYYQERLLINFDIKHKNTLWTLKGTDGLKLEEPGGEKSLKREKYIHSMWNKQFKSVVCSLADFFYFFWQTSPRDSDFYGHS